MKISIYYQSTATAWGGGNQFLKALAQVLRKRGEYADDIHAADAIIFNSYQELPALMRHFFFRKRAVRVYRLGPVFSLHRPGLKWKLVDCCMAIAASLFADVVVFQSEWSQTQAKRFGFWKRRNVVVIHNAVDQTIFYPPTAHDMHDKIRLVYTSWSENDNKGFSYLQYLDHALDFSRYEFTFIGNTPVPFAHIAVVPPIPSAELAEKLRDSDIFVSPTRDDACSNAILEALASGLPVIALASGGNSEIVGNGGILFTAEKELLAAVDTVAANLPQYQRQITVSSMEQVAAEYLQAVRASIKP